MSLVPLSLLVGSYSVSLFIWSKECILWGHTAVRQVCAFCPHTVPTKLSAREEPVGLSRGASVVAQQPPSRTDQTHHRSGPFLFWKTRCFLPRILTRTLTVAGEFRNPEPPVLSGAIPYTSEALPSEGVADPRRTRGSRCLPVTPDGVSAVPVDAQCHRGTDRLGPVWPSRLTLERSTSQGRGSAVIATLHAHHPSCHRDPHTPNALPGSVGEWARVW